MLTAGEQCGVLCAKSSRQQGKLPVHLRTSQPTLLLARGYRRLRRNLRRRRQKPHAPEQHNLADISLSAYPGPPAVALLWSKIWQWMLQGRENFVTPYSFSRVLSGDRVAPASHGKTGTDFAVMSLVNALKEDFDFSPVSIEAAYERAFGSEHNRFSNERSFVVELLRHLDKRKRAALKKEIGPLPADATTTWTRAEQLRYLRQFENFVRHLREQESLLARRAVDPDQPAR
jgi:hypothetical protein